MMPDRLQFNARVWGALVTRDLKDCLYSPAPYLIATVIGLSLTFTVRSYLSTFDTESTLVASQPTGVPIAIAIALASLYAALTSATAVASEREHHTLEVLFCGPVNATSFVLAKLARDAVIFIVLMLVVMAYLAIAGMLSNLGFRWQTVAVSVGAVFFVMPMLGASLLISVAVRRARTAVIAIVIAYVLLASGELAAQWAQGFAAQDLSLAGAYLREVLLELSTVLSWISPLSYMTRAMRLVMGEAGDSLVATTAAVIAYTLLLVAAAILLLSRKEVVR